jgi:DNA-binding response OmpR family regulator
MDRPLVLVVEDDGDIATLVASALRDVGHDVVVARNGADGFEAALDPEVALVVLDLMLPGMDGLEICRRVRARRPELLMLMLTAKSTELDRVVGLELGADDYLTKPFSLRELQARVRALFRRRQALADASVAEAPLVLGSLVIDVGGQRVVVGGEEVRLTGREFELLLHLARHPGQVFSRDQLLDRVWGAGFDGLAHTVNSHINRLRTKIEREASDPKIIQTVWGRGYKFVPPT